MRKSADHAKHAASLSHSQSHENTPGQDGEERENGVAKHVIRPGQSGDEGPTTPTDPDKAWTRPGRGHKTVWGTRGGHKRTSQRGQRQLGGQEEDQDSRAPEDNCNARQLDMHIESTNFTALPNYTTLLYFTYPTIGTKSVICCTRGSLYCDQGTYICITSNYRRSLERQML